MGTVYVGCKVENHKDPKRAAVDKYETIDEVVFAQKGDLALLGSRAMEGMNVQVDARRKKLVAAGPVVAAANSMYHSNFPPVSAGGF